MRWVLMFLVVFSTPSYGLFAPRVGVEVIVVDEFSKRVEGAEVIGTFLGVTDFSTDNARTDSNGTAAVAGNSFFPVGIVARKIGYYPSGSEVNTKEIVDGKEYFRDRKVTVVLKEKRNPIPLYAKRYSGEIPVAEQWVGFDLEKADWVAPHGQGFRADVQFRYEGYANSFWDAKGELRMRFSSALDGILDISDKVDKASKLLVPHQAPLDGYTNGEQWWGLSMSGDVDEKHRPSPRKHYVLRLRASADKDGALVEANYAKVYRDIRFFFKTKKGGVAGVAFDYYFNPTPNDRNLEFDTYRNLFRDLPHDEQVREP
ncbi:MAG: hypothetical protein CVV05_10465 [Gammaproteobacteria bacterium HGW-Gammaproteobacteria-1]|jgi:hypothetical protein|nr:MAG: hypothetical protein CVV05_10465 [Gammaproteobacteria bacterium HGW-Gammaproteobacteria-1]